MSTSTNWFDVDRDGLAALLDRRGRHRIILEAVSNSFDEPGVTAIDVTLVASGRARAVNRLGAKWFDDPDPEAVVELLIHEFGHHYSMDHLSSAYHDALCRIGARMWKFASALDIPTAVPA